MRKNNPIIDLEGVIHHQTERAVLFSIDGERDHATWLPRSQIEIHDDDGVISLPERLAIEKELV